MNLIGTGRELTASSHRSDSSVMQYLEQGPRSLDGLNRSTLHYAALRRAALVRASVWTYRADPSSSARHGIALGLSYLVQAHISNLQRDDG